jgi:hypothetical protein
LEKENLIWLIKMNIKHFEDEIERILKIIDEYEINTEDSLDILELEGQYKLMLRQCEIIKSKFGLF